MLCTPVNKRYDLWFLKQQVFCNELYGRHLPCLQAVKGVFLNVLVFNAQLCEQGVKPTNEFGRGVSILQSVLDEKTTQALWLLQILLCQMSSVGGCNLGGNLRHDLDLAVNDPEGHLQIERWIVLFGRYPRCQLDIPGSQWKCRVHSADPSRYLWQGFEPLEFFEEQRILLRCLNICATHGSRYLFSWLPGQPSGTLRFDFQTPTLAFGLNLTDLGEVTGEVRLDTNNSGLPASTVVYTFGSSNLPGNGSVLFAGVSQDTPFSSVTLTITGVDEAYGVDKVYVQSVPEPGEWAMMLAGLVPLVGIARRRRTAAQR